VPADTSVFFRWTTSHTPSREKSTAVEQLLEEPEIGSFLDGLFASGDVPFDWKRWLKEPAMEGLETRGGAFAMRLFGLAKETPYPEMAWAFQLAEGTSDGEFATGVKSIFEHVVLPWLAAAQARGSSAQAHGFNLRHVEEYGPFPPSDRVLMDIVYDSVQGTFFLSTSETYLAEIVSAAREPRAPRVSLAESAVYRVVMEELRFADGIDDFVAIINLQSVFRDLRGTVPRDAWRAVEATGLDGLKAVGLAVSSEGTGLRERYFVFAPEPRRGLLAIPALRSGTSWAARYAPASALLFAGAHIDASASFRAWLRYLERRYPAQAVAQKAKLRQIEKRSGVRIENDLLENLAGSVGVSLSSGDGLLPEIVLSCRVREPEEFRGKLLRLLQSTGTVELHDVEYRDRRVTQLRIRPSADDVAQENGWIRRLITPELSLVEDHLVLGLMAQTVKRTIQRTDSGDTLVSSPEFTAARSRHADAGGAFLYIDLPRAVELLYGSARLFAADQKQSSREDGWAPGSLPSSSIVKRHLFPMSALVTSQSNGFVVDAYSPFGSGLLALTAGSLAASVARKPIPHVAVRDSAAPGSFDDARRLGDLARLEGRYGEAAALYGRALDLAGKKRDTGPVHYHRAFALRELDRDDEAARELQAAIDRGFLVGNSHFYLATIRARQERDDDAIRQLRLAIENGWRRFDDLTSDSALARLRHRSDFRALLTDIESDR